MIELGSIVRVYDYDGETAVVTGYDEDGWPILETLEGVFLGAYDESELEEL
jgi:hypothetical protein|nr:MAG TPA: hypothetical protein [Caudoviricetes sp.]